MEKINQLKNWLYDNNIDVAYISNPKNVHYFTGFESHPEERILGLFVLKNADPFLFTPQLDVEVAKASGFKYDVFGYLDHQDPFALIADHIKDRQKENISWATEKDSLPVEKLEAMQEEFPTAQFKHSLTRFIQEMQLYKSQDELDLMIKAGQDADYAFQVGFNALRNGISEKQVVAEIEYALQKRGVMHTSFDTIVQAGKNASNPHGAPTDTQIEPNQLVLFDLGTVNHGYMSDASRTVAYGTPSEKELEIYQVVLEAQLAAQEAAKPGVYASELDKIARDVITKAGYGEYFVHRLGHGIGTSTHEYPSLMEHNNLELKAGMAFSIEPGIYIPGVAGVRIEDCGYLDDEKFNSFTHTPKDLTEIMVRD
ncbi:Xaa-Pro peptidase family protein [Holzapfeliella sp. He02]|uniref:Xaa-Pro peptidase family protein n=1 Tax=Holzapfeliella saturejae TaxID=3082953 RepID=A0ABU8SH35_9LACO